MKHEVLLDVKNLEDYKDYYLAEQDEHIEILPRFNDINIFIGANNSGKSRFLRTILKQERLLGIKELDSLIEKIETHNNLIEELKIDWIYNDKIRHVGGGVPDLVKNHRIIQLLKLPKDRKKILNSELKQVLSKNLDNLSVLINLEKDVKYKYPSYYRYNNKETTSIPYPDNNILNSYNEILIEIETISEIEDLRNTINYYIPTLRTAHSLFQEASKPESKTMNEFIPSKIYSKIKKDIFKDTMSKNYDLSKITTNKPFFEDDEILEDITSDRLIYCITGLNLYNDILNSRNGNKKERDRFSEFEQFLAKEFFGDKNFDIIARFNSFENNSKDDNNEIIDISIDNKNYSLYNLGDGIQSIIILMYGIFLAPSHTLIFIDEPELNLHPGMQRLFLEQITSNPDLIEKNLKYVIVTHSNHLLDLTLEKDNVSIFSFSPKNKSLEGGKIESKFLIKNVNAGDNELLRNLGVNNSSVFLANSSIWVEGVSDRNYIKAFLHAYCRDEKKQYLKEDIDFAFLEYAGSNLEHYDFTTDQNKEKINAFALNNKIFILSDTDSEKENKHKILQKIARGRDNIIYKTTEDHREIENLLSIEVWKKILPDYYDARKVKKPKKISDFVSIRLSAS